MYLAGKRLVPNTITTKRFLPKSPSFPKEKGIK